MLQMGDEGHNRNRAGTLMLLRELLPAHDRRRRAVGGHRRGGAVRRAPTTTSSSTSACRPASWRPTRPATCPARRVVTAMARNGTDFGIQVSGTGDEWFTGPANTPEGLYLGALRPGRRQPRHRRLGDHRDRRHRRLRDGRGAGDRPVRRRRRAVRAAGHPHDVRDHPRRAPGRTRCRSSEFRGTPDRHRRHQGGAHRHPAADQHRHGRRGWRAPARSAPAWSPRRRSASRPRWPPWPRRCRRPPDPSSTRRAGHPWGGRRACAATDLVSRGADGTGGAGLLRSRRRAARAWPRCAPRGTRRPTAGRPASPR